MAMTAEDRRALLQKYGYIAPDDDGFFGELADGFCLKFAQSIGLDEIISRNQQWQKTENISGIDACGRAIGEFAGSCWFIIFPALLVLCVLFVKKICKKIPRAYADIAQNYAFEQQQKESFFATALEELDKQNLDKSIWAQALMLAKGDEAKAKSFYIKLRAKKLGK
jgi:hypothetical protein